MFNFIACFLTIVVGYIACLFFPDTELPSVFSIAVMGYFILKKFDDIKSGKK